MGGGGRGGRRERRGLARRLRAGEPAVLGRLQGGKLLLDVRTVFAEQEAALVEAVIDAAGAAP